MSNNEATEEIVFTGGSVSLFDHATLEYAVGHCGRLYSTHIG